MKISKSRDVKIKMAGIISFAIAFLTAFACILIGKLELEIYFIILAILFGLVGSVWFVCFLLIKYEKNYYLIDKESIKLLKKDEIIFELKTADIIEMNYIRFFWMFTFQMGSGYLNISYPCEGYEDKKFSTIFPNKVAIHSISMSKKQANQIASLLNKNLIIK